MLSSRRVCWSQKSTQQQEPSARPPPADRHLGGRPTSAAAVSIDLAEKRSHRPSGYSSSTEPFRAGRRTASWLPARLSRPVGALAHLVRTRIAVAPSRTRGCPGSSRNAQIDFIRVTRPRLLRSVLAAEVRDQ